VGKRGPRPAPQAVKELRGERADRMNPAAPPTIPGRPEPPELLDPEARKEWDRIVPILEAMGVLGLADAAALALHCASYSIWAKAQADIAAKGLFVRTGDDSIKPNPAVTIARDAMAACFKYLTSFGLTPSARSDIKVPSDAEGPKDRLADFTKSRRPTGRRAS
jgi:P27 family predicted phage terminase small subunit